MNYLKKQLLLRLRFMLIPLAHKRTKWLRKKKYFKYMGENVHFQPRILPADPQFIKIHNNVSVASGVTFVNHDIIHMVISNLDETVYKDCKEVKSHLGCIEILDNVFIGSNATIMPNVRIGPNVIIAANAVITKDITESGIYGGIPAKKVGDFDALVHSRINESLQTESDDRLMRIVPEWEKFYLKRDKK